MSPTTLPFSQSANYPRGHMEFGNEARSSETLDWMKIGVGCTLLTGSLLLLTGKRKAGLLATFAGATLAALEHKEVVREWWDALPGYLDTAQQMLDQATSTIDDLSSKRDKIMSLLGR
jgi:hypothetical protein